MSDLIKGILMRELERFHFSTGRLVQIQTAMERATVETEDIIRCHECQHMKVVDGMMLCPIIRDAIEPDDYCSFGKRRTCGEDACDL